VMRVTPDKYKYTVLAKYMYLAICVSTFKYTIDNRFVILVFFQMLASYISTLPRF